MEHRRHLLRAVSPNSYKYITIYDNNAKTYTIQSINFNSNISISNIYEWKTMNEFNSWRFHAAINKDFENLVLFLAQTRRDKSFTTNYSPVIESF